MPQAKIPEFRYPQNGHDIGQKLPILPADTKLGLYRAVRKIRGEKNMLLIHKNQRVANITLSTSGRILAADVINRAHMPVGTYSGYPALTTAKLQRWLETRTIPGQRQGRGRSKKRLGAVSLRR